MGSVLNTSTNDIRMSRFSVSLARSEAELAEHCSQLDDPEEQAECMAVRKAAISAILNRCGIAKTPLVPRQAASPLAD